MNQFQINKVMHHPEKIFEWRETGSTTPLTIEFDLTNNPCLNLSKSLTIFSGMILPSCNCNKFSSSEYSNL